MFMKKDFITLKGIVSFVLYKTDKIVAMNFLNAILQNNKKMRYSNHFIL